MKTVLIFLSLLLLHSRSAEAQACGTGMYFFTFYSVNGTQIADIRYDFYEVHPDSLAARLREASPNGKIALTYFGQYFTINSINDIVISAHQSGKTRADKFNKMSGSVRKGKLQVVTRELFSVPHLLRITAEDQQLYYIGNFFGGCHGSLNILLN
ncbi:MAG: hypothetical protein JNL13_06425 [Chitinophagaceae bacterium]|nr:hypothetical protein [Chitinophagaceae bacterium]